MTEIQTNDKTILFVEVPEEAKEFDLHHNILLYPLGNDDVDGIRLPIGQYQILGKSTELTEEQIKGICDSAPHPTLSKSYYRKYTEITFRSWLSSFQESYLSLLEANRIDNNKHYLVLEKL